MKFKQFDISLVELSVIESVDITGGSLWGDLARAAGIFCGNIDKHYTLYTTEQALGYQL